MVGRFLRNLLQKPVFPHGLQLQRGVVGKWCSRGGGALDKWDSIDREPNERCFSEWNHTFTPSGGSGVCSSMLFDKSTVSSISSSCSVVWRFGNKVRLQLAGLRRRTHPHPLRVDGALVFSGHATRPLPRLLVQTVLLRRAALLLQLHHLREEIRWRGSAEISEVHNIKGFMI